MIELSLSPAAERLVAEEAASLRFYQNGLEVPQHLLSTWARARGEIWVPGRARYIPDLAPAAYAVCLSKLDARFGLLRSREPQGGESSCDSGQLSAAGELTLRLSENANVE